MCSSYNKSCEYYVDNNRAEEVHFLFFRASPGRRWGLNSRPSEQGAWERAKNLQMYLLFISLQCFKKEMFSLYYNAFLLGVRLEWGQSVQSLGSVNSLRPLELQPGLPVHHQLPEFTQTHVHLVGDAIQPSHPLLPLLLLPPVFPSIKVFSSESVLRIRWPKREKAEREGQVLLNPMPAWPLCAHAPRRHTETLKRNKY